MEITLEDFYSFQISGPPAEQLSLGIEIIPHFSNLNIMEKGSVTTLENPPLPVEVLVENLSVITMEAPPPECPSQPTEGPPRGVPLPLDPCLSSPAEGGGDTGIRRKSGGGRCPRQTSLGVGEI